MPMSVGVIVPCKDEADTIERCLRSVRTQVPSVSRLVVVDNGSTDGSLEVARRLADDVLELPGARIGSMRNAGAAMLDDVDVVAFVDADCELLAGWLTAALRALRTADLVGARAQPSATASWVARRWAVIEAGQAHSGSLAWSQHLAVRAETFRAVGGFDEALATGEDGDLSARIRRDGGTVRLVEDMLAVHHGFPPTLSDFLRRERWHTAQPGWFAPMSAKSRLLVLLAAGWASSVVPALFVSGVARSAWPVLGWGLSSTLLVVALGVFANRSLRHAVMDGTLLSLWAVNRAARLPRELWRWVGWATP